jgi:hypothetical protein
MEKVITLKELQYIKMYKEFYSSNQRFNWFHSDTVKKVKIG